MSESLLARKIREVGGYAELVDLLGADRVLKLTKNWEAIGRPEQIMPGEPGSSTPRGDWRNWLVQAGRGFGKSRCGAEAVKRLVKQGRARSIALIAPTLRGARRLMVENPFSGLLGITPEEDRPEWFKSDGELHWPNGAIGYVFTSEEPDAVRGFNGDLAWLEEIGAWKYPMETWSNLQLGLRVTGPRGDRARAIITTTPRPTELIRSIVANPRTEKTGGSTFENAANLDADALAELVDLYGGTRLGRQELDAELLTDTPGALWTISMLDKLRVRRAPDLKRVVIGVDPAVKDLTGQTAEMLEAGKSGETGIVAAGVGLCSCLGKEELHGFVLDDVSAFATPAEWAELVAKAYNERKADRVIAEINNGGALVESNLRTLGDQRLSYRAVHAAKGKQPRAEPISSFYEKGRVHHVGTFAKLEDQMTTWQPLRAKKSPDRMDALVWALTDLMLNMSGDPVFPTGFRSPKNRI